MKLLFNWISIWIIDDDDEEEVMLKVIKTSFEIQNNPQDMTKMNIRISHDVQKRHSI
jgi:hypothetical protein